MLNHKKVTEFPKKNLLRRFLRFQIKKNLFQTVFTFSVTFLKKKEKKVHFQRDSRDFELKSPSLFAALSVTLRHLLPICVTFPSLSVTFSVTLRHSIDHILRDCRADENKKSDGE